MLRAAQSVGAFEKRDTCTYSSVDAILHDVQMERHGLPLPTETPSSNPKAFTFQVPEIKITPPKDAWDNASNSTRATGFESSTPSSCGTRSVNESQDQGFAFSPHRIPGQMP